MTTAFDNGLKGILFEWYGQRKTVILDRVSAFDVLRNNGVRIKQRTDSRAEQIKCPFHGQDNKPSAKVYPDSPTRKSHVWCYVCQKSWDAIGLHMMYSQCSFSHALKDLERTYGIDTPAMPTEIANLPTQADLRREEGIADFQQLLEATDRRLLTARDSYKALHDMQGYLIAGSIIDKLLHQVTQNALSPEKAVEVLKQLSAKVGQKIQAGYLELEKDFGCPAE